MNGKIISLWILSIMLAIIFFTFIGFIIYHNIRVKNLEGKKKEKDENKNKNKNKNKNEKDKDKNNENENKNKNEIEKENSRYAEIFNRDYEERPYIPKYNKYGTDNTTNTPQKDIYIGLEIRPKTNAVKDISTNIQNTMTNMQGQICTEINRELGDTVFSQYVEEEFGKIYDTDPDTMNFYCDKDFNFKNIVNDISKVSNIQGIDGLTEKDTRPYDQFSKDIGDVFESVAKYTCNKDGTLNREKTKDLIVNVYESVCHTQI
jgi:hypothetical protein